MSIKKVVIFTNTDWHFYAHLLPIANEAKNQGYELIVVTSVSSFEDKILEHGIKVVPILLDRSSVNPFKEISLFISAYNIIKQQKPDILHNFTIKPIIYGTIIGCVLKVPKIINNFLGMGFLFMSRNLVIKLIKYILSKMIALIAKYRDILFIVQNADDKKLLINSGIAQRNVIVQCSVGIDSKKFEFLPEQDDPIIFALVARMIVDKGVYEFIEAAKILKKEGVNAEFWLVGEPDLNYKTSIPLSILQHNQDMGHIKYLGYRNDIRDIWQQAHVAVLPSYREGLSRSLLEAGAFGRALITCDEPGGRELIEHGKTGLIVRVKDANDLADKMRKLLVDTSFRKTLAMNARAHIIMKYDSEKIAKSIVGFYSYY